MTYLEQSSIAGNSFMHERIAQCATGENIPDANAWTSEHSREWAAAPGWDAAWASAWASHPNDDDYNPGKDEAVITDQMILSQVQSMNTSP